MLNYLIVNNEYPTPQTRSPTHQWACSHNYREILQKGNHLHGGYDSSRIAHEGRRSHEHIDIKCGWRKLQGHKKSSIQPEIKGGYNELSPSIIVKIRKLVVTLDMACFLTRTKVEVE